MIQESLQAATDYLASPNGEAAIATVLGVSEIAMRVIKTDTPKSWLYVARNLLHLTGDLCGKVASILDSVLQRVDDGSGLGQIKK